MHVPFAVCAPPGLLLGPSGGDADSRRRQRALALDSVLGQTHEDARETFSTDVVPAVLLNPAASKSFFVPTYAMVRFTFASWSWTG